jgi:hypothetical protein
MGGSCTANCGGSNIACGGMCVNPSSSNQYCGASGSCTGASAGSVCGLQEACVAGSCQTLQVSCSGATPPAPTFASIWPATTGWIGSNGKPISLTIQSSAIAGATYECRTGPIATVGSLNYTECDGGSGTGLTYTPAPGADGEHRTDVRIRTSTTCVGAATSYSFYAHASLNSATACAPPATDAQIFAKAAQYISQTDTFPPGSQLVNPFIQIPFNGRSTSVLSLRHLFTMSSSGTMLSVRRSFVSAKMAGSCTSPFRFGYSALGTRVYGQCTVVVFDGNGDGVCLSGTGGNLSEVGVFTSYANRRLAGPAPKASFFSNRPFSQKSLTIQNDPHWIYLPD